MHELSIIGYVATVKLNKSATSECLKVSVCETEKYKDKSGMDVEKKTWYNIPIFNEHLIKHLSGKLAKGAYIFCRGTPEFTIYTGDDGKPRPDININIGYNGMFKVLKHADTTVPSSGGSAAADATAA